MGGWTEFPPKWDLLWLTTGYVVAPYILGLDKVLLHLNT